MSEKREAVWRAIAEWASEEEASELLVQAIDMAIDDEVADGRWKAVKERPCYRTYFNDGVEAHGARTCREMVGVLLCPSCTAEEEAG